MTTKNHRFVVKTSIVGSVAFALIAVMMVACQSDNDHFCAKYSYYYRELTKPGIMPLTDIERQLMDELRSGDKDPDKTKMALFVLRDVADQMKPSGEEAQDYCQRLKLWQRFH